MSDVRRTSIIVGLVAVAAVLGIYIVVALVVGTFGSSHPLVIGSIMALLFGLALLWQGVSLLVDPSRKLVTTLVERERMTIGGRQQYVERTVGQTSGTVSRTGIYVFTALGVALSGVAIVMAMRAPREAAKRNQEQAAQLKEIQDADPNRQLAKATTLAEAYAIVKPMLADTTDKLSTGAGMLWGWASKGLTWDLVRAFPAETTVAQIQRDPVAERGKRLCVTGKAVDGDDKIMLKISETEYVTALRGREFPLYADDPVRFCGIALGRFDRTFTELGPRRTALVVGMFDPAGEAKQPAEAPARSR